MDEQINEWALDILRKWISSDREALSSERGEKQSRMLSVEKSR